MNPHIEQITVERGNFRWEKGIRDSKVIWEKHPQGRWQRCFSNLFHPNTGFRFICGTDPYQKQGDSGNQG